MDYERFQETPIHRLNVKLNNNDFYIKRDDLLPFSFGGNKARKAFLFFQEIEMMGCDYVVTYGSSSSNHCRVVANIAASKRIPCIIISPNEVDMEKYNSKMMVLFGAEVITCKIKEVANVIKDQLLKLKDMGYTPYFIPGGGHGDLGTQAYVDVYDEIKHFEDDQKTFFDYIFVASGTGTTQAGLVCGKIIHQDLRRIIGVSIARKNPYGEEIILESVNSYLQKNKVISIDTKEINLIDDYVLNGYGSYNNSTMDLIKELLINDGVPLDKTYTGKAFWGMNEYIKRNNIVDQNILFIHTGGTPLFFNDLEGIAND